MRKENKYIKALEEGQEIVIIAADEGCDSAIFYLNSGELWAYSRHMGEFPRAWSDLQKERLKEHLHQIEKEGGHIFIRGWSD